MPGKEVYRNKLVRTWWFGISVSVMSIVFFSLSAVKAMLLGLPLWVAPALVAIGAGFALFYPMSYPRRTIPDYLMLDAGEMWAVYGKPESAHRTKLNRFDFLNFEGGGTSDVFLTCSIAEDMRAHVRLRLSGGSYSRIEDMRLRSKVSESVLPSKTL